MALLDRSYDARSSGLLHNMTLFLLNFFCHLSKIWIILIYAVVETCICVSACIASGIFTVAGHLLEMNVNVANCCGVPHSNYLRGYEDTE